MGLFQALQQTWDQTEFHAPELHANLDGGLNISGSLGGVSMAGQRTDMANGELHIGHFDDGHTDGLGMSAEGELAHMRQGDTDIQIGGARARLGAMDDGDEGSLVGGDFHGGVIRGTSGDDTVDVLRMDTRTGVFDDPEDGMGIGVQGSGALLGHSDRASESHLGSIALNAWGGDEAFEVGGGVNIADHTLSNGRDPQADTVDHGGRIGVQAGIGPSGAVRGSWHDRDGDGRTEWAGGVEVGPLLAEGSSEDPGSMVRDLRTGYDFHDAPEKEHQRKRIPFSRD